MAGLIQLGQTDLGRDVIRIGRDAVPFDRQPAAFLGDLFAPFVVSSAPNRVVTEHVDGVKIVEFTSAVDPDSDLQRRHARHAVVIQQQERKVGEGHKIAAVAGLGEPLSGLASPCRALAKEIALRQAVRGIAFRIVMLRLEQEAAEGLLKPLGCHGGISLDALAPFVAQSQE